MSSIPKPIHDAAAAFDSLPGVGPRAALRYAAWLAAEPKESIRQFARAFEALADGIKVCRVCGLWSDGELCSVCRDPSRDPSVIAVVGTSQDARVIEDSGVFRGRYHVLGGLLDPIAGKTPETLSFSHLLARVRAPNSQIRELILAFDPDVAGDTTALYLSKQLANDNVKLSRLARGIPHGAQIEYADGTTIADALQNRRSA